MKTTNQYIIYDHISPSGKHYIGQTCQKAKYRWGKNGIGYKECPVIYNAIKKYGWDHFEHKMLFSGLSKLEADLIEEDLIYYYKKIGKSYNVTSGGEGVVGLRHSEETKKKLSESKKGFKNPNYHKTQSKEWVDMIVKIHSISVLQYSKSGEFIKRWESIAEAGRELGIDRTNISRAMRGERKTAGGYKWVHKRGEDKPPLE